MSVSKTSGSAAHQRNQPPRKISVGSAMYRSVMIVSASGAVREFSASSENHCSRMDAPSGNDNEASTSVTRGWRREIDPFAFHHQRAPLHLGVNIRDVLAQNADKEKLHRGKEEKADENRCHANRQAVPK